MKKKIIYSGEIRNGAFGKESTESYSIIYDQKKFFAYLDPMPQVDYSDESYRNLVNDGSQAEEYFKRHDHEQAGYFKFIAEHLRRGQVIADCGCGAGSMLDLLKGFSKRMIAIEPFRGYHSSLKSRGYKTYNSCREALLKEKQKVDLALSIHVIEHTFEPQQYLEEIYSLLSPTGKAIIITPNLNDILLKLYPEVYSPFFFRTVHNYYFTGKSLELLGDIVGFKRAKCFFYQEFGIGNIFTWLKEKQALGDIKFEFISKDIDENWKRYLEFSGQSYNVGVVLEK
jgi:2-polyprenyl-3-methyl-5-hydroxy-6-metoxy-1,4-benzoquinol methylase